MTPNKREQIEKLLWEAYKPNITPNVEELSEKIVEIFSTPNKERCKKHGVVHKNGGYPSCSLPSEKEACKEEIARVRVEEITRDIETVRDIWLVGSDNEIVRNVRTSIMIALNDRKPRHTFW